MKLKLMLIVASLAAAPAFATAAADPSEPKTREQVRAELSEAIRTGEMLERGGRSRKLNEVYPGRYPAKPAAQKKTRAQVLAELAEANRSYDNLAPHFKLDPSK